MTRWGIIKQIYGEYSFIYSIVNEIKDAENIAMDAYRNSVQKNCHFFIRTISDNANIGDVI
jgi:hypothetical protein